MSPYFSVLYAAAIALSCSVDAFSASFAYGSSKIKIPMISNHIINITCSLVLGAALLAGLFIRQFLSVEAAVWISFAILFILGAVKLLDGITKSIIRKYSGIKRQVKFSMFNFKFILSLYADPEKADVDSSRIISPGEAAALAISLSLDGIGIGFGAALGHVNVWMVIAASLIFNMAAISSGCFLGEQLSRKTSLNLSWLGGLLLIIMAFIRL